MGHHRVVGLMGGRGRSVSAIVTTQKVSTEERRGREKWSRKVDHLEEIELTL